MLWRGTDYGFNNCAIDRDNEIPFFRDLNYPFWREHSSIGIRHMAEEQQPGMMCGKSLLEVTTELIFGLSPDELHSHPVSLQPCKRTNDRRVLLI